MSVFQKSSFTIKVSIPKVVFHHKHQYSNKVVFHHKSQYSNKVVFHDECVNSQELCFTVSTSFTKKLCFTVNTLCFTVNTCITIKSCNTVASCNIFKSHYILFCLKKTSLLHDFCEQEFFSSLLRQSMSIKEIDDLPI